MANKVAIVTGANKGIGLAIVKELLNRFVGVVYLTSRDKFRGLQAVAELNKLGLQPEYHELDVADKMSVEKFREFIANKHGGIDILVNNAGVASTEDASIEPYDTAKYIIDINYRANVVIQELLFPLLRNNARVVNISSDCGHLSNIRNKEWIKKLSKKDITIEGVNEFVNWFLDSIKDGTFKKEDFADDGYIPAYRVSKVALCLLTFIQQREVESRGIKVNVMHPGLVATDMTRRTGFYTPDQSAETPLYLALDAPDTLKGAYVWHDKSVLDWYDSTADYYFKFKTLSMKY